jgi:hypothetical protein
MPERSFKLRQTGEKKIKGVIMRKTIMTFSTILFLCLTCNLYEQTRPIEIAERGPLAVPVVTQEGARLRLILINYSMGPIYQKIKTWTGKEITFCNVFARDILDNREYETYKEWFGCRINAYGCEVSMIFPRPTSVLEIKIHDAYLKAIRARDRGQIKNLSPLEAQVRANAGIPVWIISDRFNHEAIVCPDKHLYDEARGPLIAQAGRFNGVFYASDDRAFGAGYKSREIKFYEFPMREGGEK